MWTCPQCRTQNQDTDSVCLGCAAARPSGRFPLRQPASAPGPRVQSVTEEKAPIRPAPSRSNYQPPDTDMPKKSSRQGGVVLWLARLSGTVLTVLLPLLTALLAYRQYEPVKKALMPLLLPKNASDWQSLAGYLVVAAVAVLLSMLPGLWTLLLCRRSSQR